MLQHYANHGATNALSDYFSSTGSGWKNMIVVVSNYGQASKSLPHNL